MKSLNRPASARRDCTVTALSLVADIPYAAADAIASAAGRTRNKGFNSMQLVRAASAYGIVFEPVLDVQWRPLADVRLLLESGRFYVRVRGHAFAVIDGQVMDDTRPRCVVEHAWRYCGTTDVDAATPVQKFVKLASI